jgi:hypothetical protein
MKIQITRATISEKRQVYSGQVLDVSKTEGLALICAGKAVEVQESAETTAVKAQDIETTALPSPQSTKLAGKKSKKQED